MKNLKYAMAIVLIAGMAYAVKQGAFVDRVGSPKPQWFDNGIYVGSAGNNPTRSTDNRLDAVNCFVLDYDFPAIGRGAEKESVDKVFTVNGGGGVKVGDPCIVGVGVATPTDGGSAYIGQATYDCIVRADNQIRLRVAAWEPNDGGAVLDVPDAGYNACVFHNGRQAGALNNGQ